MRMQRMALAGRGSSVIAHARRARAGMGTVTIVACLMLGTAARGTAQGAPPPQAPPAEGSHLDASIGLTAGTLGFGVQAGKLLFSHLGVRAGFNYFSFSLTHTFSGVAYTAKLRLQNIPALVDVYPWGRGPFHLTGGLVFNQNQFTGTGVPDSTGFTINQHHYTQSQVGVLHAAIKYPSTAGYGGIGFGTSARNSLIAPVFDIGAVFSTPRVTLGATGAASNPQLASDLQAQQDKTQHDVRKFRVYPVISTGFMVRF
jgi:hypothetical protein